MEGKKQRYTELTLLLIGTLLYAISSAGIANINIVPGSTIGLSELCYKLFGMKVGTVNFLLNVPIILICIRRFGKKVLYYTVFVLAVAGVMTNIFLPYAPVADGKGKIVLAILGGLINGTACGLLMRAGGSVGGTSAIVRVLKSRFQELNVTLTIALSDAVIYVAGMLVLHDKAALLYSVLFSVAASACIDFFYTFGRDKVDVIE